MSPGSLSVRHHFADLPDPRRQHGQRHRLLDVIVIALCAVIAGSNTWQKVETFARCRRDWLARFLKLENGVPCHDTFERVFDRLDPVALQRCLLSWHTALAGGLQTGHVAIDGHRRRVVGLGVEVKGRQAAPAPRVAAKKSRRTSGGTNRRYT